MPSSSYITTEYAINSSVDCSTVMNSYHSLDQYRNPTIGKVLCKKLRDVLTKLNNLHHPSGIYGLAGDIGMCSQG